MGRMKLFDQGIEVWIKVQDNKSLCEPIWCNTEGRNESIFREKSI